MHLPISLKQLQIDKANSMIFIVVATASVVAVFSLISTKALLVQAGHHKRVLNAKQEAVKQLEKNVKNANDLMTQFKVFNDGSINIIGGANNNNATGPKDGDNARITLDALPSQYDFPALISSLDKILTGGSIANRNIGGSDQSATIDSSPSANPKPVALSFSISGTSSYAGIQNLIKDFERSTRPFDITNLQLSGTEANMRGSFTMNTYFQPATNLTIGTKEVK